jgi:dihydroorotase-like cyclic amidohydrolase
MKKIIKNGIIVTAADTYTGDVAIENGVVTEIGLHLEAPGAEVIDASGCYLFPGGIDPHTHLDMPFGGTVTADDFETGTIAAIYGGTTTVIDYSFHLMVSELNDKVLGELPEIIEKEGITSLKVFMAYKNTFQADDGTLFKTLQAGKKEGALVMVHAENGDVIEYLVEQADLVIFDPSVERTLSADTHHMNVDYNAFEGFEVKGEPVSVLSRGEFVIRDKQFVGKPGSGKYLKRKRFAAEAPLPSKAEISGGVV